MAEKREAQRERILEAFERCLYSMSFEALSMRAVAQEAGIALGSIYYYFENKEDLLVASILRSNERYMANIREALTGLHFEAGNRDEYLGTLLRAIARETGDNKQVDARICITACLQSPFHGRIRDTLRACYAEYYALFADLLSKTGFPDPNPLETAKLLCSVLDGIVVYGILNDEALLSDQAIEHFISILRP